MSLTWLLQQAQGRCMEISTYNYKSLSANLQVPRLIFIECSEAHWVGGLMPVDQGITFPAPIPQGSTSIVASSLARRGSGSALVHWSLEEAVTEESVNHGGLLQFGVEQQCKD